MTSATKSYYPVALDLAGRRCLVVGGGEIATDKVNGLLAAGAEIRVVSPGVTEHLARLAAQGDIELHLREYSSADLDGMYLAYGATDDRAVNARVSADARALRILVNAVDDIPECDFFAMAIVRRGDLQVAVSTNGKSPAFARWMRESLDDWLPSEYAGLLEALGEARSTVRAQGLIPPYEHWRDAITPAVLSDVQQGQVASARDRIVEALEGGN